MSQLILEWGGIFALTIGPRKARVCWSGVPATQPITASQLQPGRWVNRVAQGETLNASFGLSSPLCAMSCWCMCCFKVTANWSRCLFTPNSSQVLQPEWVPCKHSSPLELMQIDKNAPAGDESFKESRSKLFGCKVKLQKLPLETWPSQAGWMHFPVVLSLNCRNFWKYPYTAVWEIVIEDLKKYICYMLEFTAPMFFVTCTSSSIIPCTLSSHWWFRFFAQCNSLYNNNTKVINSNIAFEIIVFY